MRSDSFKINVTSKPFAVKSYIYIYIYIYVCVCACVCVRERERERECVCVYIQDLALKGLYAIKHNQTKPKKWYET